MEGKLLHKVPLPEIDLFVIIIQFFFKCIILFEVTYMYINLSISGLTMSTTNSPPLWKNAFSKSVHTIGSSAIPIFHLDNLLCGSDFLQLLLRYNIKTHFNSLMLPVVMKKKYNCENSLCLILHADSIFDCLVGYCKQKVLSSTFFVLWSTNAQKLGELWPFYLWTANHKGPQM